MKFSTWIKYKIKKIFISPIIYILIPLVLIILEIYSKNTFINKNLLSVITLTLTFSTILISIFSAIYSKHVEEKMQHRKTVQDREITLHTEGKWRLTLFLFEHNVVYTYYDLFVLTSYINPYSSNVLDQLVNSAVVSILNNKSLDGLEKNLIEILKDPKNIQINNDVTTYSYSIFEISDNMSWQQKLQQKEQNIIRLCAHTLLYYDWYTQMSKIEQ